MPPATFVPHETVPWRDADGYETAGAQEKILYHDEAGGTYVRLLRWPAGFVTGTRPLAHEDLDEFAWVVSGGSTSLATGASCGPGSFCVVPRGVEHGPFETRGGVVLLEVRQPRGDR